VGESQEEGLTIKRGGRLVRTLWLADLGEGENGRYVERDATQSAIRCLFEECGLAPDATLKDVLLLLDTELDAFDAVFGHRLKEIVEEGLRGPEPKKPAFEIKTEYLELYWWLKLQTSDGKTSLLGTAFPMFHGLGKILEADDGPYKKGERTPYALDFLSAKSLAGLPLKLKNEAKVGADSLDDFMVPYSVALKADRAPMTLGQIIQGIVFELSFWGAPADRDEAAKEILARGADAGADAAGARPAIDFLDSLLGPKKSE
jgi:hypothetical protein